MNIRSTQMRVTKPRERITISFKRFLLLRAIVEAAKAGNLDRQIKLIDELETLEVKQFVGTLMSRTDGRSQSPEYYITKDR